MLIQWYSLGELIYVVSAICLDTFLNAYVIYYLIEHINYKRIIEARSVPGIISVSSVKSAESIKLQTLDSAKYLIVLVVFQCIFEWLGIAMFSYVVLGRLCGNLDRSLYMFINLFCRATTCIHILWICLQFKLIKRLAAHKARELVSHVPLRMLKDIPEENSRIAKTVKGNQSIRTQIVRKQ